MKLSGSIVALITPFNHSGEIDTSSYEKIIDWHCREGSDGIVCCGTTGEGSTLRDHELYTLFDIGVKSAAKRIPVIASTGSNDTQKSIARTKKAKEIGADAALVIVPYYNRPTQRGILAHFEAIASVGLPIIIYHNPRRCAVDLEESTLKRLLKLDSVVGFKDASGSTALIDRLDPTCTAYFSGDDAMTVPMMERGALGVISAIGNAIPAISKEIVSFCLEKKFDLARERYDQIAPFCKAVFSEVNPQGVKYAVSLLGLALSKLRLPLVEPLDSTKEEIASLYQTLLQSFEQI